MPRRILGQFLAVVAILATAAGASVAPAAAADPDPTVRYWTEDRIRGATPREAVVDAGSAFAPAGPALAPAAVGDVTGDPWTGGGAVLQRSGLVLFTLGVSDYSCSGTIIEDAADPTYSLVMTAAHCVYDQVDDVFATNWTFIPAWDSEPDASGCSTTAYGCWTARALVVHHGWADEEDLTVEAVRHDYGVAVVRAGGKSATQLDALGAYPVRVTGLDVGDRFHSFGYPAGPPYQGDDLVYCLGNAGVEPLSGAWRLVCDMTSGASGGPWLFGSDSPALGCGALASVNSFRMFGDAGLYAPRFDGKTQKVLDTALAATPDAVGTDGLLVSGSATVPPWQSPPFVDIGTSTFCRDIEWLSREGITSGCSPTTYCPTANVSRGQMAAFLVRALDLPPTATDYFDDDNGSTFENDINALRKAEITFGCALQEFCPTANVSRGQMAAFLVRALDLPPTATDHFDDDDGTFENDINALATAGITTGCGPTTYCPTANVTRGQMAAFLRRALE